MPLPALVLPALLAAAPGQDAAELRQKLAALEARLGQVDQQLAALKKRRKGVLVELQGIALQRDRAKAQVEGARLRRDEAQAEAQAIQQEQARIQGELRHLRADLRRQIRWMQALGPMGELGVSTTFKDLEAWLERGRLMAWTRLQERKRLDHIQTLQGSLALKDQDLHKVLGRLTAEAKQAAELEAALRVQEERLGAFLKGLEKDERAQKQVQGELAEEALQLERLLAGLLAKPKADAFEPSTAFANLRGVLPQPVSGTLAQGFGEHVHPRFRTRTMQSGLLISAPMGAPVVAVAAGRVVFADHYQSYGTTVILDHGGGWFTLYTHLLSLDVAKGQVLQAQEALGAVGETVEGPRLGFEIRHQTQAQDPQKWLKPRYR